MAISAGDAERSERQRHWVLSLANDQGFEYVTEVLNSMIERERERVEALTLDEKENLIARARLSAFQEAARIPADIVITADSVLSKWEKQSK
jgi:hypothetical protein|tara:strand:- start:6808 stop:7083 length:276 start_codon:yes stop_codon:yes gene_type:complete